jgi:hypothetical protein
MLMPARPKEMAVGSSIRSKGAIRLGRASRSRCDRAARCVAPRSKPCSSRHGLRVGEICILIKVFSQAPHFCQDPREERELSAAYSQYSGPRKITHAPSDARTSTMPPSAIMRCDCVMLLTRSTVTRPHTPTAVTAPITTRARITRRGKFKARMIGRRDSVLLQRPGAR